MADSSRFPAAVTEAPYTQFTTANGDGLVDQLTDVMKKHMQEEYNSGRLTGSDYAKVLVGSLQSVLQFSTQYLVGTLLFEENKEKARAEISMLQTQEKQIEEQLSLIQLQKEELRYRIENLLPLEKQQMEIQNTKLEQERLLLVQQTAKLVQEVLLTAEQVTLTQKQGLKMDQEVLFMQAKVITENANTQSGVAAADSLIGKQIILLNAQQQGFTSDMLIKTAKVYADYDAVVESVNENGIADLGNAATQLLFKAETTAGKVGILDGTAALLPPTP